MNTMKRIILLPLVTCLLPLAGCSDQSPTPAPSGQAGPPAASAVGGTKFLLTAKPEGANDVIKVREDASHGDDVVIVGRIGGSANPWVEGRAAFSIVDGSLKACSDIEGDNCPIPWDYCCDTSKLPTATALVKVVDEEGALVKADARALLSVKELSTVIVKGKAQRDDSGNLTVLASGVFIKKL